MATIKVVGPWCGATLAGPDEDGDYGWAADCGTENEYVYPLEDAVNHAEIHVDDCDMRAEGK